MEEEIVWKEHEIHRTTTRRRRHRDSGNSNNSSCAENANDEDDYDDDCDSACSNGEEDEYVFDFFSPAHGNNHDEDDQYETFEVEFPNLRDLRHAGVTTTGEFAEAEEGIPSTNNQHKIMTPTPPPTTTTRLSLRGRSECCTSTGLGLWKGANVLCQFLIRHPTWIQDKRVLELGAGVGMCGLVAHVCLGASRVLVTDGDTTVLRNLRYNIRHNTPTTSTTGATTTHSSSTTSTRNPHDDDDDDDEKKSDNHLELTTPTPTPTTTIACHQLIWGRQLDGFVKDHGRYDVIMATDCVYMTASLQPLWQTVHQLLEHGGIFLYANLCASQAPLEKVLEVAKDYNFTWTSYNSCDYKNNDNEEDDASGTVYVFRRNWGL